MFIFSFAKIFRFVFSSQILAKLFMKTHDKKKGNVAKPAAPKPASEKPFDSTSDAAPKAVS